MRQSINTFSIRENIRLFSILLLFVLSQKYTSLRYLAISWPIIIIVLGNLKRISREIPMLYFIRMTLYFAIYLLPLLIDRNVIMISKRDGFSIIIGCAIAVIVNCLRFMVIKTNVKVMLSKELIVDSYKDTFFTLVVRIYNLIGAAMCEELLFRKYILSIDVPKLISLSISVLYFVFSHYILIWGDYFRTNDYYNQFLFGMISALLFLWTRSVIPCLLLHLLYNSVEITRNIKVIDRHYIHPERYKNCAEADLFRGKEL